MTNERLELLNAGLQEIPIVEEMRVSGKNGEELATDEAAVWKRVLQYRIAQYYKPEIIVETHPGLGVSTTLYKMAVPDVEFKDATISPTEFSSETKNIIDIDPFGQPWDFICSISHLINEQTVLMISNGEAYAVRRNLVKAQRFPTTYYGKRMPVWVKEELIPYTEKLTGLPMRFFYAFPTTVRIILSKQYLPDKLFAGCPHWMWWLSKYA